MTLEKIRTAIEKYDMLCGKENVTVALSGGADSVCLLHALISLKDIYKIKISDKLLISMGFTASEIMVNMYCRNFNFINIL